MRKIAVLITALVAVFAVTAVALAAQVNTYTVTASGSPTKAGSKKHPVTEAIKFDYSIAEAAGQRPATVSQYSIFFKGLRTNGKYFKKCTADQINSAGSDSVCNKAAKVGSGSVDNQAGPTNDPTNKSIACHLALTLYNAGQGKLALYLAGGPSEPQPCAVALAVAIPGVYKNQKGGQALQFSVPSQLLHPIPGIDNAVVRVTSTIPRKTAKVSKKVRSNRKVGYFESIGGCTKGKRTIAVTFTQEDGAKATKSTTARCKK
jgi:hypothetical protein